MSAKSFVAITSEGGMLPVDFLQELVSPRTAVDGLTPASYHLAEGERISEQVNRSWNRLKGCWANFRKATADRKPGDPTTSETRERWLQPLFQELGFGQKLPSAKPIEIEGRLYPVSHGWGNVPMHLVGSHVDIDRRTPGAIGAAKASPHSLVQQTLNASDNHLWGVVSNGVVLRLLRDNVTLTRMAYVEWDLAAIFDGDLYSEFFLLWLLCHQSRFEGERPDQCWLEKWKKEAADKSFRALEDLRPGVESAISSLGAGLVSHPANRQLLSKLRSGELSTQEFYRQILRVVYRMIFLFAAEDRGLLHPPLPENDPEADAAALKARQRYRDFYSLSRLRRRSMHRTGTPHPDLWTSFQLITQKLGSDDGCPELALPPLGSFLWQSDQSTPDLNGCLVSNRHFLFAVHSLAFVKSGGVRRSVDYRNLGAEEIGAVYEGLLELHPKVNAELGTFELDTASGNERKTSGSYYTPESLVQCLLDTALDPVVDQAVAGKNGEEAAQAILRLRVCDPAVGSGHFLIAAAHRMARRLAAARTGEEEPSPEANGAALRDVIGHCLYGVDINPMSAELCRVSLWLEALEPGKPLSFLDHHIRVGNSLLGATPALVAAGIPDDAFNPIEGDEKAVCSALKRCNALERRGHGELFAQEDARVMDKLRVAAGIVDELPDDSPDALKRKEQAFRNNRKSEDYLARRYLLDTWCAAFVIKKVIPEGRIEPIGITTQHLNALADGSALSQEMADKITQLAKQYQFFHWHLEFPEVFGGDSGGGFNVMLGNPPWDKIQPEEEKFFAVLRPDIANAPSAKIRKALIAALPASDPPVHRLWEAYKRRIDGTCHFLRSSGALRFTGDGNLNSYRIFTELCTTFITARGRAGLVAQTGLATDESGKELFDHLLSSGRLCRFLDFENRGEFFVDVHQQFRFCLVTIQGRVGDEAKASAEFGWLLHSLDELDEPGRLVRLSSDDLLLFNPSSRTSPVFTSEKDVGISRHIYSHGKHVMLDEERRIGRIDFLGELFNMTRDSGLFLKQAPEESFPLYEAKFIHQFDHRFAEYVGGSVAELTSLTKSHAGHAITPKSLVDAGIVRERLLKRSISTRWLCGFRDIASATNERTSIAAVFPVSAVGNSINMVLGLSAPDAACFVANANSFVFDYCCRQKLSGTHVNIWIFKQLPAISLKTYVERCAWVGQATTPLRDWLLPRVLELTYTAWDLEPFAQDCGWGGPPFRWDDERRFLLRCELDAAFFHLYSLSPDDAAYIMDTFPIVKRKDEAEHGTYRTKDTILEIYDAMQTATSTGKTYQTRLDPPPGPPIGKDGKFVKYEDIAANPPPHIHLPRGAKPANNEWQLADLTREFPRSPFKLRINAADGTLAAEPVNPSTIASGDHVVIAHPDLHRGQKKLAAVTGQVVSIANRQDAASNEPFVHLAVQDTDGVVELRLSAEEWGKFESIGVIKNS